MLPIIYQGGELTVYSYPVVIGIAWAVSFFYIWENLTQKKAQFLIFFSLSFITAWMSAKLVFILSFPQGEPLLKAASFWLGGGFVFYGGLLGVLLFLFLWITFIKRRFDVKLLVPALCLGHGIGRVGCFLAGCCYGKKIFTHYHWPVQLIEALSLVTLFYYFHIKTRTMSFQRVLLYYLASYGVIRFLLEFLRGDIVRGHFFFFSTSQWISLFLLLVVTTVVVLKKKALIKTDIR